MRHTLDVHLHGKQHEGRNNGGGADQCASQVKNQAAHSLDPFFGRVVGRQRILQCGRQIEAQSEKEEQNNEKCTPAVLNLPNGKAILNLVKRIAISQQTLGGLPFSYKLLQNLDGLG